MKKILFFLLLLASSVHAQRLMTQAKRIYPTGNQVAFVDSAGGSPTYYPATQISVKDYVSTIAVSINALTLEFTPARFLNASGQPYGSTVQSALDAYGLVVLANSNPGATGPINATQITTGTLSNSRLDPSVLTNTSSHTVTGKRVGDDFLPATASTYLFGNSSFPWLNGFFSGTLLATTFRGWSSGVNIQNNANTGSLSIGGTGSINITSPNQITANTGIQLDGDINIRVDNKGLKFANNGANGTIYSNAGVLTIQNSTASAGTDAFQLKVGAGRYLSAYTDVFRVLSAGGSSENLNVGNSSVSTPLSFSSTARNQYYGGLNNAGYGQYARGSDGAYTGFVGYATNTSNGSDFIINATGGSGRVTINGAGTGVLLNSGGSTVLNATSTGVDVTGKYTLGTVDLAKAPGGTSLFLGNSGNTTLTGTNNLAVGNGTGLGLTTGTNNVLVGHSLGSTLIGTNDNVLIGIGSSNNPTIGARNTLIGYSTFAGGTGGVTTFANNIAIGAIAGRNVTGTSYQYVNLIGVNAGAGEGNLNNITLFGNSSDNIQSVKAYGNASFSALNIGPTQSVTAATGSSRAQLVIEDNTSSASGITMNAGGSKSLQIGHLTTGGMYLWTNTGNVNVSNHLQPFSHNGYDLGLPGTRWRNVYVAGTVLTVNASASSDIEVTTATSGIILKSPNGTRWRITIDDTGTLVRTAL